MTQKNDEQKVEKKLAQCTYSNTTAIRVMKNR